MTLEILFLFSWVIMLFQSTRCSIHVAVLLTCAWSVGQRVPSSTPLQLYHHPNNNFHSLCSSFVLLSESFSWNGGGGPYPPGYSIQKKFALHTPRLPALIFYYEHLNRYVKIGFHSRLTIRFESITEVILALNWIFYKLTIIIKVVEGNILLSQVERIEFKCRLKRLFEVKGNFFYLGDDMKFRTVFTLRWNFIYVQGF